MIYPKVSVIISTYDRPDMLREAVESVLAQTMSDWELIVVDDASDTAQAALEGLDFSGHRCSIYNLPENSGYQSKPKNVGLQYAVGSYVAYLDDDNLWDAEHLETLVDAIENADVDIVYGRWRYEKEGKITSEFPFTPYNEQTARAIMSGPQGNFVDTSSILHSRSAVLGHLGSRAWSHEVRRFGDWVFITDCLSYGLRMLGVDAVTFTYRWHGDNLQLTRPATSQDVAFSRATAPKWSGRV